MKGLVVTYEEALAEPLRLLHGADSARAPRTPYEAFGVRALPFSALPPSAPATLRLSSRLDRQSPPPCATSTVFYSLLQADLDRFCPVAEHPVPARDCFQLFLLTSLAKRCRNDEGGEESLTVVSVAQYTGGMLVVFQAAVLVDLTWSMIDCSSPGATRPPLDRPWSQRSCVTATRGGVLWINSKARPPRSVHRLPLDVVFDVGERLADLGQHELQSQRSIR